jgi:uncharacterized protein RhaS with RHS repeats
MNDSAEERWLTPDPVGGDITNPQSLNRYTYVLNQRTTLTDPSGLQSCASLGACNVGISLTWDVIPILPPAIPL